MKKSKRSKAAFGFALAAAFVASGLAEDVAKNAAEAWIAPPRAARKQNPVPSDAKSITQGKALFAAGCLPCHGPAGKGDGPAAIGLERNGVKISPKNLSDPKLWEQTDGALFWKISEGKTPMPAFQEAFSEEQRWQVINYVRTLALREGKQEVVKTNGGK